MGLAITERGKMGNSGKALGDAHLHGKEISVVTWQAQILYV
jgi:hypothetical protein